MRSSTSSSRLLATAFAVLALAGLVALHERTVRRNFMVGGFVAVVDWNEVLASGVFPGSDEADVLVLGSSRAKESIRPAVITAESEGRAAVTVNRACHSCSSLVQARNMAAAVQYGSKNVPKSLIVTVEPLHFMGRYAPRQRDVVRTTAESGSTVMDAVAAARAANRAFLDTANAAVAEPLYATFKSFSPTQRRPLPLWERLAVASAMSLAQGDWRAIPRHYDFYIGGRANRFFTLLTEFDAGFEGHTLKLSAADATRAEAFENHLAIYRDFVLPDYRPDLIAGFADDITTLRAAGIRIVLVRLPVHAPLYALEDARTPDFDARMQAVADRAGVPYLALQARMPEIAGDEFAFTDGSHFESAATTEFTRRLWQLVDPLLR